MREMLQQQRDVFYYVTVGNENQAQADLPAGVEADVVKGMYRFAHHRVDGAPQVRLLGSGAILLEVIAAAQMLADEWQIGSEVWSVTSYSELARDAREVERFDRLHPVRSPNTCHVAACLAGDAPIVAASDHVRALPQSIAEYLGTARFVTLGTDGFGRSDTRQALRAFFEVDRRHIVHAALFALTQDGRIEARRCAEAMARYAIAAESTPPWLA
jgi:pyruvate dehydrogenase E1 component